MGARPEQLTVAAVKEAIRRGVAVKIDPDGTVWIGEPQPETTHDPYSLVDVRRGKA